MLPPLAYTRLYADPAGESHFEPIPIETYTRMFAPPAPPFNVSDFVPASGVAFVRVPGNWIGDLHPSPIRMWVFMLAGEMEFEASDGERHPMRAGNALLLEDVIGKGHVSRVIGDAAATLAVVELAPAHRR